MRRRRPVKAGLWTTAQAVERIIFVEVPGYDASREMTTQVVHDILVSPAGRVEFILDSPVSANWRLKRDQDGRPRVAYYGHNQQRYRLEAGINGRIIEVLNAA